MKTKVVSLAIAALGGLLLSNCATGPVTGANAANASASEIVRDSRNALSSLYRSNPKARAIAQRSKAVLVFPSITKGGFMLGGMGGNGALLYPGGGVGGYYQTAGVSYGLQAGIQKYGYALFLMNNQAIADVNRTDGWEIGSSPSVVVVDQGMSGSLSTTTLNKNVYAVFFDQKGLMAGLGLQGSKITRIRPGQ